MDKKNNFWYINFNIKNYTSVDDIIPIIDLIDKNICKHEQIYGTNIIVKISRSTDTHFDYICTTNIKCTEKKLIEYLDYKFIQIQNQIKTYQHKYGTDWYIKYTLK